MRDIRKTSSTGAPVQYGLGTTFPTKPGLYKIQDLTMSCSCCWIEAHWDGEDWHTKSTTPPKSYSVLFFKSSVQRWCSLNSVIFHRSKKMPKFSGLKPSVDAFEIDDVGRNSVLPRPPLGLKPRSVHDAGRLAAIEAAVARYSAGGVEIPLEWSQELSELRGAPTYNDHSP